MKLVKSRPFLYGAGVGVPLGLFASTIEPWDLGLAACILFPIIFGFCLLAFLMIKE